MQDTRHLIDIHMEYFLLTMEAFQRTLSQIDLPAHERDYCLILKESLDDYLDPQYRHYIAYSDDDSVKRRFSWNRIASLSLNFLYMIQDIIEFDVPHISEYHRQELMRLNLEVERYIARINAIMMAEP